ncbi:FAS1 domain-containing protein [Apodospora peruviana]|uniref:FAS1 domain-containing protein n=1 Tax=Apodospora peruviana TaxID=516989 RepID=A0AAE0MGI5_9PEZI|nr:FAS1 domain-containing protein [Apodospora peruviana]
MLFGSPASYGLPASLLALLAVLPTSTSAWSPWAAVQPEVRQTTVKPLNEVLAGEKKLQTYYALVKEYPDILLQLPSYDGVTLVAPSDDAFEKYQNWDPKNASLVTNLLQYHILQGTVSTEAIVKGVATFASSLLTNTAWTNVTGGQKTIINKQNDDTVVFVSGLGSRSTVTKHDIEFTGGLVQVVDTLMVPPARLEHTARDAYKDCQGFLGALYAAGLAEEFATTPNVTIFAPRNSAFQRIASTLESLSKDELRNVLRYHIVPGAVLASPQLVNGTNLTTAAKDLTNDGVDLELHVIRSGNNMYFNTAQLEQPDILIANGIMHIVADVLNPEQATVYPNPTADAQNPVFPVTGTKTEVGLGEDVPFTTAFPCTENCPVTSSSSAVDAGVTGASTTTSVSSRSSQGMGAAGPGVPRCTGMPQVAAAAVGAAGLLAGIVGVV